MDRDLTNGLTVAHKARHNPVSERTSPPLPCPLFSRSSDPRLLPHAWSCPQGLWTCSSFLLWISPAPRSSSWLPHHLLGRLLKSSEWLHPQILYIMTTLSFLHYIYCYIAVLSVYLDDHCLSFCENHSSSGQGPSTYGHSPHLEWGSSKHLLNEWVKLT